MSEDKTKRAALNRRHYLKKNHTSGNCQLCGLYEARRRTYKRLALCVDCFAYATLRKKTDALAVEVEDRRQLFVNIARAEDAEAAHRQEQEDGPAAYPLDSCVLLVLYVSRSAYVKNRIGHRTYIADKLRKIEQRAQWVLTER